ncbi:MAG: 2,3-bisphosphoglycerate-independent phosphoglycerate mutase [Bacteroidetes bacterium]|nr:MAG: 2,3-bisphosphoglycerate-independent phosphoglycerate mutase [Bacteroidota bacterium]
MENKKFILMILDGWGIGNGTKSDAIKKGDTPYIDSLLKKYPNASLLTSGEDVGLPNGQMGNSEVGHMNIGAGRVVFQDLVKINNAIKDNSIAENQTLLNAFEYAKKNDKAVHFIGLISDGGVHSLDTHLYKLCDLTGDYGLDKVYIHAITDGRDTDPKSGLGFMKQLENHLEKSNGTIASLIGRYYTMDRDKRWDRVKEGYDLMVHGKGKQVTDIVKEVENSYKEGITDEFIKASVKVDNNGAPVATIKEDDVVICFNYRTDRLREITTVLSQEDMADEGMKCMNLHYLTMTKYDERFKGVNIIYDKENIQNTIGAVISKLGKKQLRIAETEKFAHVTFFMSGGTDNEFEGESRVLVQSPKVATYDLQPEMSAFEVTEALVAEIKKQEHDLIILNFANGDMVGHTGIYEAILKAIKTVDECVEKVVETAKENGYDALIIADHGNADNAINENGSPNTAHSLNPVPSILVSNDYKHIEPGILADVAPTILKVMGIEIPKEMTGKVLV